MSKQSPRLACQLEIQQIPVERILPMRLLSAAMKKTVKYSRIAASIRELGIIEPLMVYPLPEQPGFFLLLDGHVRLELLKIDGAPTAPCLLATDDEAYTYNHKVNQLSAIQEHFMIAKAVKNGVTEVRIAKSLNVDVANIMRKLDLLNGVCPEVVTLLKEKKITAGALREIRKSKPLRQIEIAELMITAGNYSVLYAKCLITATPAEQLVDAERAKEAHGLSPDDIARMEREMDVVGRDFKRIEESHGKNVLNLVIVVGYLAKLLDNARVVRFLSQTYPELLAEFQKLVESKTLSDGGHVPPAAAG